MAPLLNASYWAVERQWLKEYLNSYQPFGSVQYEKRLTVADLQVQQRLGAGVKPRAASRIVAKLDAWLDLPAEIQIWEAKRRAPVAAVVQLHGYQLVLPHTWEGNNEVAKPITWHVLAEHEQINAEKLAAEYGISYHIFLPDWLRQTELDVMAKGEARRNALIQRIAAKTPA